MPFTSGIRTRILAAFAVAILGGVMVFVVSHTGHQAIDARIRASVESPDLRNVIVDTNRQRSRMLVVTYSMTFTAVTLGVVMALLVERSLRRPLRKLEDAARRIGSGDLETRVALPGNDELARLGRCFDEMAVQLAQHQRRLVETEKLAGIGQLSAGVAHELNNPLAVVRGYATLLARHADERVSADAKLILEESLRCQAIVAGLLDLARPQHIVRRGCNITALCREAAALVGQGDGADIEVRGEDVTSAVDADKFRQVLRNLLRNAREAAPEGTSVQVSVTCDGAGDRVRVAVRDHGKGLDDDVLAHLFEPFFTTKGNAGTGLGLPVSAAIVRAHGGEIIASNAPGAGALFEVLVPIVQVQASSSGSRRLPEAESAQLSAPREAR